MSPAWFGLLVTLPVVFAFTVIQLVFSAINALSM